ncbi:MAG: AAA family ATPase [Magnetococcales bacterium]|nr:AAA family ATPase [Magnetococcales bacterium]
MKNEAGIGEGSNNFEEGQGIEEEDREARIPSVDGGASGADADGAAKAAATREDTPTEEPRGGARNGDASLSNGGIAKRRTPLKFAPRGPVQAARKVGALKKGARPLAKMPRKIAIGGMKGKVQDGADPVENGEGAPVGADAGNESTARVVLPKAAARRACAADVHSGKPGGSEGAARPDSSKENSVEPGEQREGYQALLDLGVRPLWGPKLAGLDVPPRPWVSSGNILAGSVSVLHGPGGAGKTQYAIQSAINITLGRPWATIDPVGQFKVLYISLEEDAVEIRRRVDGYCQQSGIDRHDVMRRLAVIGSDTGSGLLVKQEDGSVVDSPFCKAIMMFARESGIGAIFVDPLQDAVDIEENRNEHVRAAGDIFRMMARYSGSAVVLLHHNNKGGKPGDQDGLRGGSALAGIARSMESIYKAIPADLSKANITPLPGYSYTRVDPSKRNYASDGDGPIILSHEPETLGNGDEVGVLVEAKSEASQATDDHERKAFRAEAVPSMEREIFQERLVDQMAEIIGTKKEMVFVHLVQGLAKHPDCPLPSLRGKKLERGRIPRSVDREITEAIESAFPSGEHRFVIEKFPDESRGGALTRFIRLERIPLSDEELYGSVVQAMADLVDDDQSAIWFEDGSVGVLYEDALLAAVWHQDSPFAGFMDDAQAGRIPEALDRQVEEMLESYLSLEGEEYTVVTRPLDGREVRVFTQRFQPARLTAARDARHITPEAISESEPKSRPAVSPDAGADDEEELKRLTHAERYQIVIQAMADKILDEREGVPYLNAVKVAVCHPDSPLTAFRYDVLNGEIVPDLDREVNEMLQTHKSLEGEEYTLVTRRVKGKLTRVFIKRWHEAA